MPHVHPYKRSLRWQLELPQTTNGTGVTSWTSNLPVARPSALTPLATAKWCGKYCCSKRCFDCNSSNKTKKARKPTGYLLWWNDLHSCYGFWTWDYLSDFKWHFISYLISLKDLCERFIILHNISHKGLHSSPFNRCGLCLKMKDEGKGKRTSTLQQVSSAFTWSNVSFGGTWYRWHGCGIRCWLTV